MTTANFFIVAEPPRSAQVLRKEPRVTTKKSPFTELTVQAEPEACLWKICSEVAPQQLSRLEWTALLFFAGSALLSLIFCAFEWVHVSNTGALEQIVRTILTTQ
jgi:hypothetical protein